jgi:uncharacterized tellurite resistance protein B-like protein
MANSSVIMALAKVLVAAAWADGQISNDEINSLKDLMFHFPGMTAKDWDEIDIYIESPVEAAERQRLLEELRTRLSSPADEALALRALEEMIAADGETGDQEQAVAAEIIAAIQEAKGGAAGRFSRLMSGKLSRRSQVVQNAPNRELFLDDFVKNRIYYDVSRRLESQGEPLEISDAELRKLCLGAGLLARAAYVDRQLTEAEKQAITDALRRYWNKSPYEAGLVAEVALSDITKNLDYYRLTRQFFECTSEDERLRFLDVLFAVSASDGRLSNEEIEEIRTIATGLLLTHQQFIDAKLKIPRQQRAN